MTGCLSTPRSRKVLLCTSLRVLSNFSSVILQSSKDALTLFHSCGSLSAWADAMRAFFVQLREIASRTLDRLIISSYKPEI